MCAGIDMMASLAVQSSAPDSACVCTHVSLILKVVLFFVLFCFSIAIAPSLEELGFLL